MDPSTSAPAQPMNENTPIDGSVPTDEHVIRDDQATQGQASTDDKSVQPHRRRRRRRRSFPVSALAKPTDQSVPAHENAPPDEKAAVDNTSPDQQVHVEAPAQPDKAPADKKAHHEHHHHHHRHHRHRRRSYRSSRSSRKKLGRIILYVIAHVVVISALIYVWYTLASSTQ